MSYNEMKYGVRVRVRDERRERVKEVAAKVAEMVVGALALGGFMVLTLLSGVCECGGVR